MNGLLSVVATPIGNMEDITLRALRVLKEADYVLCEDTRVTGNLCKHHGIETKLRRYDAHASEKVHADIVRDLEGGKRIALVSDAGTPGVSDPGVLLVAGGRAPGGGAGGGAAGGPPPRRDAIPGASALTALFSIAGVTGNSFAFLGFIPMKKGRQTFFKSLSVYAMPVMCYEAPHRIMKTLESLAAELPETATVIIGRELTKMFEEVVTGTPKEVLQYFTEHSDHVRGEFVVLIEQ